MLDIILQVSLLLSIGAVAGIMAGLLGIGGGLIIVPVLFALFLSTGQADTSVAMHVSIGTSLATIVLTSISSILAHQKHRAILWQVVIRITPAILLGGLAGALIAGILPGSVLRIGFAVFLLLVAVQMLIGRAPSSHRSLPGFAGMSVVGSVIGAISAIMGIGGGTMSVPFLIWCNVEARKAVATSAAIGLPIALSGTVGFIIAGLGKAGLPSLSLGYVNIPAFVCIVIASVVSAPIGARYAHRIPHAKLKRIFAVFLLILAIRMIFISD
jgi:uncharacterized membrane protein YfcA